MYFDFWKFKNIICKRVFITIYTFIFREKQLEYKKLVAKDVEKRRKVNIPLDWKDNPDRYLLELAGKRPNYARFEKDTQDHSSLS